MKYKKIVKLKDGRECCIRNGTEADGKALLSGFLRLHGVLHVRGELFFQRHMEDPLCPKLALARSFRFFLATHARFLVVLAFADFG